MFKNFKAVLKSFLFYKSRIPYFWLIYVHSQINNLLKDVYTLVDNIEGLNLIFIRNDKLTEDLKPFPPEISK